jgi:hypothetical protein
MMNIIDAPSATFVLLIFKDTKRRVFMTNDGSDNEQKEMHDMADQDHYEGFEKESKFNIISGQALCDCPVLKARTVARIIAHIDPTFTEDLFTVRPCIRKLRYIGCGCAESPCPHHIDHFFKEGKIYTSIDFNGGTYMIEGYGDGRDRIGAAYFEWIKKSI